MGYKQLDKAIRFATKAHKGQFRDGPDALPYSTHPVEVVANLRYIAGEKGEEMLTAAALHDVVESSGIPFPDLEKKFGATVTALVKELTRREPSSEETEGLSVKEVQTLRRKILLDEIKAMTPGAQKIKLADRLSNVEEAHRTLKGAPLKSYLEFTRQVLEAIPREVSPPLWDQIKEKIKP